MFVDLTGRAGVDIRCCRSIDEQAALLESWNQTYCQISRGAFDGSVSSIRAGALLVLVERMNRSVFQRGCVDPRRFAIGIPFQLEGHSLLCGQSSHRDGLHLFSGADGFEFLSPDKHVVVNLEITVDELADPTLRAAMEHVRESLGPRPGVIEADRTRLHAFRTTLAWLLDAVLVSPAILADPRTRASFEQSVVLGLADLVDHIAPQAESGLLTAMPRNWKLIGAARELIEASPDCPLSVAELCARLGVSRRTIQYAFEDVMGMNPASYLRTIRLDHVRKELRVADSVTDAATRWGFWHFGHFSNDYREQFGELPSETLRRFRGSVAHTS
ncbi:AraC family transcriptional regulator, ethanolamine operon transcriptional activator [Pararobbsia alpina]|uniref:helix-turn-helix domain-containing protein n=1 Tax=Pararobbsia alpina TaxID=621374 RepID=UPI0039A5CCA8